MVPHIKVEEKLHDLTGSLDRPLVVTGVGDDRKGERLVVLHCLDQQALQSLLSKLPQLDLPRLWVPKANQFFHMENPAPPRQRQTRSRQGAPGSRPVRDRSLRMTIELFARKGPERPRCSQ